MDKREKNNSAAQLSDEAIIELYWNREECAISATDDKYGRYLFTIAYNIVRDELDCEECLNDTYLGTWNSIPPTRPNIFQVFLSKIMRNVALDKYRKNSASKRIPSEMIVSIDELDKYMVYDMSAQEEFLIRDIGRLLSDYLRELPDKEEFMFVCRYYYADYISDIAKMLEMNPKTVSKALAKLRDDLKAKLEKEGYYHE
ncbi:MAG: sigma-70 family RNA polymerase sigma factor [Clostridia bacterium]|nr:sigma-70 family RNA polymerase sigma factor [Clostridia bacterium]